MSNFRRKLRYFSCDFETTVYEGQTSTEVWASAMVELGTEDVQIFHSIEETWKYIKKLKGNLVLYYHNLKFDGSFWLDYLITEVKLSQAYKQNGNTVYWKDDNEMYNNEIKYSISDMGQWYSIMIKQNDRYIEIRDSLKLLPFSVKQLGKAFKTKHQKLDMEYVGYRYAGCEITDEEKKYIANDVLVVKEALEIMFEQGHNKMTIGACCMSEYKNIIGRDDFKDFFPDLTEMLIDEEQYGSPNADKYIRKSYKGGWCYLVKGKENKVYNNGTTADVNSLYPSMMSSESGNYYPIGKPTFWKGNFIPDQALMGDRYFFIRIKTRFYIKKDMLPFIQIKGSWLYKGTEALMSSDIYSKKLNEYSPFYADLDGNLHDTRVTLTLTQTDYILFREHYDVIDFEILDGCWFSSKIGLFDGYIEKYKKIKLESTGALRTLAKLFLNNLYGKMASNNDSSFKVAFIKEDNSIGFNAVPEFNKPVGYIPIGSAITSYARNFTIRSAQKNYYGVDKPGFIYADTDSIHCDLPPEKIKGIIVHDKNFCCWKLESCWDKGLFVRQKTYIEHITHEDLEPIDKPFYNIKCAGMPSKCKNLFNISMQGYNPSDTSNLTEADLELIESLNEKELDFIKEKRELTDFKIGLTIPGKLLPKRIKGGILLVDTTYELLE